MERELTADVIVEAFAAPRFIQLRNRDCRYWELRYCDVDNRVESLNDTHLDRLIKRWVVILETFK